MTHIKKHLLALSLSAIAVQALAAPEKPLRTPKQAEELATAIAAKLRPEERTVLTHGIMPLPLGPNPPAIPADAIAGAGYVPGIARLGVPALKETDASLGVAYVFGIRKDGATALPSGLALASTWNNDLAEQAGRMIGQEARAKGFNVMLAGGANLARDPRNGRNFEYFGEDPLLSGLIAGHSIRGIQSNNIISTIKHFALNGQETGRKVVDSRISESAARESDLLAFQIGIEVGNPGSVMCAYNRVNGHAACANDWLLNKVLKQDWRYKGFVMSDWGAVPGLDAAVKGLDQQSGAQLDAAVFFGKPLADAGKSDPAYAKRIDDMNKRVLWAIYSNGLDLHPAVAGGKIDFAANGRVVQTAAEQGIVLLRNERNVLPLAASAKRIAVIGGYADTGVLSGAGSSQVQGEGGPSLALPLGGNSPWAAFVNQAYHRSVPLDAIKAMAPSAEVKFRDGRYISEAVAQAKRADVAIVFATQWSSEGFDQPDLSLPNGQDALIEAVARANPNTIVILETGGPVAMPWLDKTAAVLEAWYPGARGGEALAALLFGKANPSGRLPVTFPANEDQLPRPKVDGFETVEPSFTGEAVGYSGDLAADYDIEGSDVGYRWFAQKGRKPLFPFGFGLSYTRFANSELRTNGDVANFSVKNVGDRDGAVVSQLYLVSRGGEKKRRLLGYQRLDLAPGATQTVSLKIDPRLMADWKDGQWVMPAGDYQFALGDNAEDLGPTVTVRLHARSWRE
ncbi:beta-glucosidase family protein [Sphingobium nicotianae]|uniref:Glycoside hydrolase family 3 C-terminal domain-containing protein n=1 Tax=Sphingobium nicotianae TaxID=2782607 RepID=A0A9X1IPG2_9SPHN|nr:glycoside hydrolase family 3 C-terminal domain-containing protein [Sphingobium nicotianae]MBT2186087.1 glycoside hydrolase family 3 C-terminal domain-containing protein [Sphingobium nicotianae]